MTLAPRHKFLSLLLMLAGLGGTAALLAPAARHPLEAHLLHILAGLWLLSCGAAKLVFDVTEAAMQQDDHAGPLRHAGE